MSVELRAPRSLLERLVRYLLAACALLSIGTTIGIVFVLLQETIAFFAEVSLLDFFTDTEWTPLFAQKHFGIWPLFCGTFLTTLIAMCVALPLGLLSAIYLSEFAGARRRSILKPALELLAGVPTVVYGYFALMFVSPLLQALLPGMAGFNALSAGLVMGVMIVPMIASLSDDAIYAVPDTYRDASYALGAGKVSTIRRVVLPAAFSGIAASVLLAISRAVGETMIVAIAAGQQPTLTLDPRDSVETMTAYIVQIGLGDTPTGTLEYRTIFAVGMSLFLMTLGLNVLSYRLRKRILRGRQ